MTISCLSPAHEEHFASFYTRQMLIHGRLCDEQTYGFLFFHATGRLRMVPPDMYPFDITTIKAVGIRDLLYQHSLYPFIVMYEKVLAEIELFGSYQISHDIPFEIYEIAESSLKNRRKIHFCPECMRESVGIRGWAFYKRLWSIPGVEACPHHNSCLAHSEIYHCQCLRTSSKRWFQSLLLGHCVLCGSCMWPSSEKEGSELKILFAQSIERALIKVSDYYLVSCKR